MKTIGAVLLLSILLYSCKKDGPAGPAGATGPKGSTGATGGINYKTIYKNTILNWTTVNNHWESNFMIPEITQAVFDSGYVEVAFRPLPTGSVWTQLPYSYQGNEYSFYYMASQLNIVYSRADSTLGTPDTLYLKINVVSP